MLSWTSPVGFCPWRESMQPVTFLLPTLRDTCQSSAASSIKWAHCDPMTSPSLAHRRSHSDSKYCEVWQMQLMHHWLPQLVWEHLLVCSVLGLMTHFLAFTGRSNLYLTPFSIAFLVRAVIQNNVYQPDNVANQVNHWDRSNQYDHAYVNVSFLVVLDRFAAPKYFLFK